MGLDIYVYRVLHPDPDSRHTFPVTNTPLESIFKDKVFNKDGELVVNREQVGYSRGGANDAFYQKDWNKESPIVVDRKVLIKHLELYFSDTEEGANRFLKDVVSEFYQDKTFVIYDW